MTKGNRINRGFLERCGSLRSPHPTLLLAGTKPALVHRSGVPAGARHNLLTEAVTTGNSLDADPARCPSASNPFFPKSYFYELYSGQANLKPLPRYG